jgi:hypothetical protein
VLSCAELLLPQPGEADICVGHCEVCAVASAENLELLDASGFSKMMLVPEIDNILIII